MNERKRLYPTVSEDREREPLKRTFRLDRTAIAKGGGMPQRTEREQAASDEQATDRSSSV